MIINNKIDDSPSCLTCSLHLRFEKPCPVWHSGSLEDFISEFHHLPDSARKISGSWSQVTQEDGEDKPPRMTFEGEFDNFIIFRPFRWSWNQGMEKCRSLDRSLLILKSRSELERFRTLYESYHESVGSQDTHHLHYPKAHFLDLKMTPGVS